MERIHFHPEEGGKGQPFHHGRRFLGCNSCKGEREKGISATGALNGESEKKRKKKKTHKQKKEKTSGNVRVSSSSVS